MGESFAGVTLPESIGESQTVSEPKGEESSGRVDPVSGTREAGSTQTTDIPDLDKLERFRFGGRELTAKQLKAEAMMQSDYSRKMQELSETRKYADNFAADMRFVLENPARLNEMKQIYPANYVQIAEKLLQRQSGQSVEQPRTAEQPEFKLPPEMEAKLNKVDLWEKEMQEQKTQATLEQLESLHSRMGEKYPYADPDVVDRRVEIAIDKGFKVTKENISKVIENAYKQHNDAQKSRIDKMNKTKVEEQVKAGRRARDVGTGGSPPGQAPKKYTKFSDISKDVAQAFDSK